MYVRILSNRGRYLKVPTYLQTPWCRVLVEKLTGLQLVKKIPAFHGTRWFITATTRFHHLSLSLASPIESTYPYPTSWRSILMFHASMLSSPQWSLSLQFPHQDPIHPLSSYVHATCPARLIRLEFITSTIFCTSTDRLAPHYAEVPSTCS